MEKSSNIRVLNPDDLFEVSENYKQNMKQMGMIPFEKDGKLKWGNKSQVAFLKSLETEDSKKLVKSISNNQLPPSLRKDRGKLSKSLAKVPVQYFIVIVLSVLLGFLYLYLNYIN